MNASHILVHSLALLWQLMTAIINTSGHFTGVLLPCNSVCLLSSPPSITLKRPRMMLMEQGETVFRIKCPFHACLLKFNLQVFHKWDSVSWSVFLLFFFLLLAWYQQKVIHARPWCQEISFYSVVKKLLFCFNFALWQTSFLKLQR